MLQNLRNLNKIISIVIAFFFVLSIFLVWGMNASSGRRGGGVSYIGKIDGEKIKAEDFFNLYKRIYENAKQQAGDQLNEQRLQQIHTQSWQQAWEALVSQRIFDQAYENYDIIVTDDEVEYYVLNEPLDEIKTAFTDPETKTFKLEDYQRVIKSKTEFPKYFPFTLAYLENYYRTQIIPRKKLENLIAGMVVVSENEIWEKYKEDNEVIDLEYAVIRPYDFSNEEVNITEQEKKDYYENNKEEFRTADRVKLDYVRFGPAKEEQVKASHILIKTDSRSDTEALELAQDVYEEALKNKDFVALAKKYSEGPTKDRGGDLGFFERGKMVKPFSDAAFALELNEISTPVKSQFGYHIIKKTGYQPADDINQLEKEAKAAETKLVQENLEWSKIKENFPKANVAVTGFFTETDRTIPGIGRTADLPEFINFAFTKKPGEISGVLNAGNGALYIIKVNEFQKEHILPYEEVKAKIERKLTTEKKNQLAKTLADSVKSVITSKNDIKLDEILKGRSKIKAKEEKNMKISKYLPSIGSQTEFHFQAFEADSNAVVGPIEVNNSYAIGKVLDKKSADAEKFQTEKTRIKENLVESKKTEIFNNWYTSKRQDIEIVDNRERFQN